MQKHANKTRNDSHHIFQDSTLHGIKGYSTNDAITVVMRARNKDNRTTKGTPHYRTQQVQRTASTGGTLRNENNDRISRAQIRWFISACSWLSCY